MRNRVMLIVALAAVLQLPASVAPLRGQQAPTIKWSCTRHPDVLEDAKGTCPFDGTTLQEVVMGTEWTCPEHTAISEEQGGKCVICKRDLVQVVVTRYWTCPQSVLHYTSPGNCADEEVRTEIKHRVSASKAK